MLKPINIIFMATTAIFAGLYFSKPQQNLTVPEIEIQKPNGNQDLIKENKLLKQKLTRLENEFALLEQMPERLIRVTAEDKDNSQIDKLSTTPGQASFRDMMNEPEIQEMMKKRQQEMVSRRYGAIIDRLDLNDADKEKLVELLGDKQLYRIQSFMRMRAATEETDKDNIRALSEEQMLENDNQIADLLGDKFNTFSNYQDKRKEYSMIESLNKKFEDQPLDNEQVDYLADAMKSASETYEFSNPDIEESPGAFQKLSKEEKEVYIQELKERDELILKEVENELTEEQLEQLKKEQRMMRQRATSSRRGFSGRHRGSNR